MRPDSKKSEAPLLVASGPVAGAGVGQPDATVPLPAVGSLRTRISLRMPRLLVGVTQGRIALSVMVLGTLALGALAAGGPGVLVPRSGQVFPNWESGPLHGLIGRPLDVPRTLNFVFSGTVLGMFLFYAIVLASARLLSRRTIVIWVLAIHAVLLLSPPLQLTDVFNYLGYARLGGLHHLNPYTHVMNNEIHDPVFRFTSWHNLKSPYGPLFTALSYPLAWMPLPAAYWTLKTVTVLMSLGFLALVWRCASLFGRDPRVVLLFVAANPVYVLFAVAGFHNDFFMLVPSTAAVALLLTRRDRAAGAAVMVAVAVKFTAILLLPFLLIAARPTQRRLRILVGATLGAVPMVALSLAVFGLSLPNLQDQATLLTPFSIPNLFGDLIRVGGGTPALLRLANVALVLTVVALLWRGRDWLTGAGWATLALLASLAWVIPWYVIWLLPLAALGSSVRLRRAAVAASVYLAVAFVPLTGFVLGELHVRLMSGSAGQASQTLQHKLSQ